ncbi:MAG TPA: hypothetical protein VH165_16735 [Kofleriaceae bacterium]|jgi:hypothetical protein|nr:hypothetical protein [Kofleriaceae bacterium]
MKLLFGIRTSGAVSLSVTTQAQLPDPPPSLMIKTAKSTQDTAVSCSNQTWATTLVPGDYVIYMPALGDSWFNGPVSFALGAPVTIVGLSSSQAPEAWTAATGTVDANPEDTKNPLPPPSTNVESALLFDATWLTSTLIQIQMNPSPDRSAPDELFATASTPTGSH